MSDLDYTDRTSYMPVTPPDEALVCLGCGLVTVSGALDVHAAFHALLEPLIESRKTRGATTSQERLNEVLEPAERMILTVARAQIQRGDNPPLNTTAGLLLIVERLTAEGAGHHD